MRMWERNATLIEQIENDATQKDETFVFIFQAVDAEVWDVAICSFLYYISDLIFRGETRRGAKAREE